MNDPTARLLVVDDDAELRTLIADFLAASGYEVTSAANAIEMDEALAKETYDLIVLDLMMPGEDGLSVLRRLRGGGGPGIIMLSAMGEDTDRIVGLEVGADDYLAKPCNPRELLARIRTVLRRREKRDAGATREAEVHEGEALRFAGWRIDLDMRMLYDPADRLIALTDGEFRLLRAFVEHPRRVLTRDQLLDFARGEESDHYDRAIDVQVSRLRRKLSDGAGSGELIRTVRNEGYLFAPAVSRS